MNNGWDGVRRTGFTVIEVMLFLAISGFLVVGILAGTGAGIARQRYNDSVQDMAQLLREQYSAVMNTQIPERELVDFDVCYSPRIYEVSSGGEIRPDMLGGYYSDEGQLIREFGRGRTACLVYGVMVTLGADHGTLVQSSPLIGRDVDDVIKNNPEGDLARYGIDALSDLDILQEVGMNNLNVFYTLNDGGDRNNIGDWQCLVRATDGTVSHKLQWGAKTETREGDVLEKTILIVRSPKDGAIRTFVRDAIRKSADGAVVDYSVVTGNGMGLVSGGSSSCDGMMNPSVGGYEMMNDAGVNKYLTEFVPYYNVERGEERSSEEVEICVGSDDLGLFGPANKRMVRILANGHNAGAVVLVNVDTDVEGHTCN